LSLVDGDEPFRRSSGRASASRLMNRRSSGRRSTLATRDAADLVVVNLLIDVAPAMAIALRPPDPESLLYLLAEAPRPPEAATSPELGRRSLAE
jgi:hypothetical protein